MSALRDVVVNLESATVLSVLPVLDLAWAIVVAQSKRTAGCGSLQQPWFQALLSFLFSSLAGTTLTCVFWLGQPPSWALSNVCLPTYLLVFAAHRYCPGDWFYRVFSLPAVALVLRVFDNVSWATSVSAWGADKALTADHAAARASAVLTVMCGITTGCAGGVVCDAFGLSEKVWRFQNPAAISGRQPSQGILLTVSLALLYYVVINPHRLLPFAPLASTEDARVLLFGIIFAFDSVPAWTALLRGAGGVQHGPATKKKQN